MRAGRFHVAAVSLLVAALVLPAAADADEALVVVDAQGLAWPQQTQTWVKDQLESTGLRVASTPPALATRAAIFFDCVRRRDKSCVTQAVKGTSATLVFGVQVRPDGSDTRVVAWVINPFSGETILADERTCESCGEARLKEVLASFVPQLLRDLDAKRGTSTLVVNSVPQGARVLIDGDAIGITPTTQIVNPGQHEIRIDHDGFEPAVRRVTVAPSEERKVDVELARAKGASRRPYGVLGIVLIGGGLGLGAGGVYLITQHQDEVVTDEGQPVRQETARRSKIWGIGMAGLGAVAVGTGIYFLLVKKAEAAPIGVSIGPRGGAITLQGTF